MTDYHIPVLLNECIEGLNIHPTGVYVDLTFGGGGHSHKILEKLSTGKLIAFDQDPDALENIPKDDRFQLIPQNFRYLKNYLNYYEIDKVDGILADLGVSSHQFDSAERGFSIRFEGPLDLRMNTNKGKTAADIVNEYSEEELSRIFFQYGEIKNSRKLARSILTYRSTKKIENNKDFKIAIQSCIDKTKENKYLATVFQALRIEVNDELGALKEMLQQSPEVLKPGGRLVIMSYHSLEDRLVKNFIKSGNFEGKINKDFFGNPLVSMNSVIRKAIVPSNEEIERNNRSRSAKLRIAEKI